MVATKKLAKAGAQITIDRILTNVDNLPTLPHVAMRVGEFINDPQASAKDIARVLRQDASLCAKVLRIVNSAYYGIPGGVCDVERAISFVGFNTLNQLVLSVSVLQALRVPGGSSFEGRSLWLHSLAVGACAEVLATRIGHRSPGTCFTAGLLHDIGKIALAITEPNRFAQALQHAHAGGKGMNVAEKAAGLPSHDRVGSRLARHWKFPSALLMPIERHHGTDDPHFRHTTPTELLASVDIVTAADEICRLYHIGDGGSPAPEQATEAILARIGLSPLHVEEIHSALMRRLESSKLFLEIIS